VAQRHPVPPAPAGPAIVPGSPSRCRAAPGICRSLANELAAHHIRVNTVHPASVDTPMVAGLETLEPFGSRSPELGGIFVNGLLVEALDPRDVSNAVCGWPRPRPATSPVRP
jgi:NAD(P)-dependent dehydrogenase (short-subunit alcohol dehydrogenase family)